MLIDYSSIVPPTVLKLSWYALHQWKGVVGTTIIEWIIKLMLKYFNIVFEISDKL